MTPFVGWLGFGHHDPEADLFCEAMDYQRPVFDPPVGEVVSFSDWIPIGGPEGFTVTHGAVFATATGGHSPLAWWRWNPLWLELPASWAPFELRFDLAQPVAHAVAATAGSDEMAKLDIARGSIIGAVNGMAVISACRLTIVGGKLVPRAQHQRRAAAA